MTATK